jgi:hypothetical protein
VCHYFEEHYLGEAILYKDSTVLPFAQEETKAASPAVSIQAVQRGLFNQVEHLAAASHL